MLRAGPVLAIALVGSITLGGGCFLEEVPKQTRGETFAEPSEAASSEVAAARELTQGFEQASRSLARALDSVHPVVLGSLLGRYAAAGDKREALRTLNHALEEALALAERAEAFNYRIVFYASDVQAGWRATLDPGTPGEKIIYHATTPFRGMGAAKVLTDEVSLLNHSLTPGRHELVFELLPRTKGYFAADVEVLGTDRDGVEHSLFRWRVVDHEDLVDLENVGPVERPWYRLKPFVLNVKVDPAALGRVASATQTSGGTASAP
jgi:hypothetical protein